MQKHSIYGPQSFSQPYITSRARLCGPANVTKLCLEVTRSPRTSSEWEHTGRRPLRAQGSQHRILRLSGAPSPLSDCPSKAWRGQSHSMGVALRTCPEVLGGAPGGLPPFILGTRASRWDYSPPPSCVTDLALQRPTCQPRTTLQGHSAWAPLADNPFQTSTTMQESQEVPPPRTASPLTRSQVSSIVTLTWARQVPWKGCMGTGKTSPKRWLLPAPVNGPMSSTSRNLHCP